MEDFSGRPDRPDGPRTVEDLQQALARRGRDPRAVGRVAGAARPAGSGTRAFRTRADGRCELVTSGQGPGHLVQLFDSEADAVAVSAWRLDLTAGDPPDEAVLVRLDARAWESSRRSAPWWRRRQAALNRTVVAYLGYGTAPYPLATDAAVAAAASAASGPTRGALLLEAEALVEESFTVPIDWTTLDLAGAGRRVAAEMAARHPRLGRRALAALAWNYTFTWR